VPVLVRAPAADVTPGLHEINMLAVARSPDGKEVVVTEKSSFFVPR